MGLTVNGEVVDAAVIEHEFEALRLRYREYAARQGVVPSDDQLRQWCRENVIERALLAQEARRVIRKIPEPQIEARYREDADRYRSVPASQARRGIENELRVARLVKKTTEHVPPPTEKAVRTFYEANREAYAAPERVRVRQIVRHVRGGDGANAYARLLNVKKALNEGAPFERLAREQSDCPDRDGDLGYIVRGSMVEEFESVVFGLETGKVSDIFSTRYGYHIVRVEERVPAGPVPFEAVRDRIRGDLWDAARRERVERLVERLRASAEVRGDPG